MSSIVQNKSRIQYRLPINEPIIETLNNSYDISTTFLISAGSGLIFIKYNNNYGS